MNNYASKFGRAFLGFAARVVTAPLAVIVFLVVWLFCSEKED